MLSRGCDWSTNVGVSAIHAAQSAELETADSRVSQDNSPPGTRISDLQPRIQDAVYTHQYSNSTGDRSNKCRRRGLRPGCHELPGSQENGHVGEQFFGVPCGRPPPHGPQQAGADRLPRAHHDRSGADSGVVPAPRCRVARHPPS